MVGGSELGFLESVATRLLLDEKFVGTPGGMMLSIPEDVVEGRRLVPC